MSFTTNTSTQHVYRGRGEQVVRVPVGAAGPPCELHVPTIADTVPATSIMSRDVVCARDDLDVEVIVDLLAKRNIGCVPVVDHVGRPIGMVTKRDLLEQLVASRDPEVTNAWAVRELMMPFAFWLDEHATIAHVVALMCAEGIHHVPIVGEDSRLIGIISTFDVVRWLATNDGVVGTSP